MTLPSKGTSGPKPCQQNPTHSITDHWITAEVKHSDLYQFLLFTLICHPSVCRFGALAEATVVFFLQEQSESGMAFSNVDNVLNCHREEGTKPEGEALDLLIYVSTLTFG